MALKNFQLSQKRGGVFWGKGKGVGGYPVYFLHCVYDVTGKVYRQWSASVDKESVNCSTSKVLLNSNVRLRKAISNVISDYRKQFSVR